MLLLWGVFRRDIRCQEKRPNTFYILITLYYNKIISFYNIFTLLALPITRGDTADAPDRLLEGHQ
jgi:hypothetical protein